MEETNEKTYLGLNCDDPEKYFKALSEVYELEEIEDLITDVMDKWPDLSPKFTETLPQSIQLQLMCRFILDGQIGYASKIFKTLDFKVSDFYPVHIVMKANEPELLAKMDAKTGYLSSLYIDVDKIKDPSCLEVIRGYHPDMGVDGLVEHVYGKHSAFYKKCLLKQIFPKGPEAPNLKAINFLLKFRKQVPLYPSDKLANFSAEDIEILDVGDVNFNNFQTIINFFGEERAMKLMKKPVSADILRDTEEMFRRLSEKVAFIEDEEMREKFSGKNLRKEFPKKPKCVLRDIHDRLTNVLEKLDQEPKRLGKGFIQHLDGIEIEGENLFFKVPDMNTDLISLGQELNICVGNGIYSDKTIDGISNILVVQNKSGRPLYCYEVSGDRVVQAYGHSNSAVPKKHREKIEKIIKDEWIKKDEEESSDV